LNNEGTEVANDLRKPDEGSLNRTVCIFFLNENRMHPPIRFTISKKCKPDGLVIRLSK